MADKEQNALTCYVKYVAHYVHCNCFEEWDDFECNAHKRGCIVGDAQEYLGIKVKWVDPLIVGAEK